MWESSTVTPRFWSKVDKSSGCWVWTGGHGRGYGVLQVGTWNNPRTELAHRVSWQLAYGEIPSGLDVLHHCDNPTCVRPSHLFLGTDADNHSDKARKGRAPHGERHMNAKVSQAQVDEMRARYAAGGVSQRALAAEYGLAQQSICDILRRKNWPHS